MENYEMYKAKWIDKVVAKKSKIKPVYTTAFGGRIERFGEVQLDNWKE